MRRTRCSTEDQLIASGRNRYPTSNDITAREDQALLWAVPEMPACSNGSLDHALASLEVEEIIGVSAFTVSYRGLTFTMSCVSSGSCVDDHEGCGQKHLSNLVRIKMLLQAGRSICVCHVHLDCQTHCPQRLDWRKGCSQTRKISPRHGLHCHRMTKGGPASQMEVTVITLAFLASDNN